ncbi:hypothetical protein PHYBOEH_009658 [Phytophthora boehmeriae]|uniref:BZIP domain-containing protein n=1 Tax=Phytophthora boehmeriae TaxID=109152 RepID=A0A8T1VRP8_9STRA|nr:hypothetical protein PHYBOEH_009658 [Phytophthora boehmeriae]
MARPIKASPQSKSVKPRKLSPAQQEERRIKNREVMRKIRLRQRLELQNLTSTVQQLEHQYAEICRRSSSLSPRDQSMTQDQTSSECNPSFENLVAEAKRLGAEKMLLRSTLKQNCEWIRLVQRARDFETSSLLAAQKFQQNQNVQLDTIDHVQAAQEFGFHPLTEQDLAQTILDHKQEMHRVETRLIRSTELDKVSGKKIHRMQAFGWNIVQRVENSVMEFVFTKRFTGLDVRDVMLKTWNNDITLETFKKVKAETCRLQVLQQVNPHAFAFVREVASPSDISIFRSVFVHFLVEATKEFAAAFDTNPQSLTGTGYVLGTQSLRPDPALNLLQEIESNGKMAWADLALTTEAYDVVDPATGETYQEVFWAGRTDYCTEEDAQRNAADTLQGLLRWEMHIVAPALTLLK